MRRKKSYKEVVVATGVYILVACQSAFANECKDLYYRTRPSVHQNKQIIGQSIFELFDLSLSPEILAKQSRAELQLNSDFTFSISKNYPSGWFVSLRHRDFEYNLVWMELDDQFRILNTGIPQVSFSGASIALSALVNLKGIAELQSFLIKDSYPRNAQSQWKQDLENNRVKRLLEDSVQPMNDLPTFRVIKDSDAALTVSQAEYAIEQYGSARALKTLGAGPCLIVSIYDPNTKTGILMHVDSLTNFRSSMQTIEAELQERGLSFFHKSNSWKTALIGGDTGSRIEIIKTRQVLSEYGLSLSGQKILTGKVENAWLDLESGELFNFQVDPTLRSNNVSRSLAILFERTQRPLKKTPK